jgi:2-polyprenyl-3-methyl-5-hydroxy-6-metoxy-1,4-benzoquinol methylase
MSLLCPNCRAPIDPVTLACAGGHRFSCEDSVLVLLEEEFGRRLRAFIEVLVRFRTAENKRLTDPALYEHLPFALARENAEWRVRCYDLTIIRRLLAGRGLQRILDVGASNGWLSHQLALLGHDVTAVELFTDEYDGLKAKKFYSTDWRAIQMDLADLSVLNERYDVVIVNHGLPFYPDPSACVAGARERLAAGGLLILIGLAFFRDPSARVRAVAARQRAFRERYGADFFLRPTRGYLGADDKARFAAQGVRLHLHPHMWRANLKSLVRPTSPRYFYGLYRACEAGN